MYQYITKFALIIRRSYSCFSVTQRKYIDINLSPGNYKRCNVNGTLVLKYILSQ